MPATATLEHVVQHDAHYELDRLFPTSLTITRTSEEDWKTRQLVVSVDGRRIAELLWGDSVMCELEPGPHVLRVHNTLVWRTVQFTVAPGEQVFYEAVNRATASTYFLLPIFGISPLYVTLRRMA
ncbi:MAG TPA: hypothetical protein VM364_13450 [Vicinamibacterales bacterium]|nr:hypothetical protein [Vicinamibacterales bacterium]